MKSAFALALLVLACDPLCPPSENDAGSSSNTIPTGGGSSGGLGWCGGSAGGGGPSAGGPSCVGTPEPAELEGCLSERACSGVAGRYVLTRPEVDAGCRVRWRNPLRLNVSLDAGCGVSNSVRWASDSGCDFRVHAEYSELSPFSGACWGTYHTIDLSAVARPAGGPSFTATTGGFGEGGSCQATFALDAGS